MIIKTDYDPLTPAQGEVLLLLAKGLLLKEIAAMLDVSQGAVKQRIRAAKTKLRARTTIHAVARYVLRRTSHEMSQPTQGVFQ